MNKYHNTQGSDAKQTELIIGEVAQLIRTKPLTIIQTIEATTNKRFIGTTYGDLTLAVGELIKTNTAFASAIVTLVYLNKGIISHSEMVAAGEGDLSALRSKPVRSYSAGGGGSGGGSGTGGGFSMDLVSSIVGAVSNITGGSLQLAAAKAHAKGSVESANINLESAKAQAEAATVASKEGTKQELLKILGVKQSNSKIIPIIVAIVIAGFGMIWFLNRKPVPPTIPAPPAPAPPVPAPAAPGVGANPPVVNP